jgi:hypothetical protein
VAYLCPDHIHERLRAANVGQLERPPQRLPSFGRLACSSQRRPERGERLRMFEPCGRLLEQRARFLERLDPVRAQDGAEHAQRTPDSAGDPQPRDLELLHGQRDRLVLST